MYIVPNDTTHTFVSDIVPSEQRIRLQKKSYIGKIGKTMYVCIELIEMYFYIIYIFSL